MTPTTIRTPHPTARRRGPSRRGPVQTDRRRAAGLGTPIMACCSHIPLKVATKDMLRFPGASAASARLGGYIANFIKFSPYAVTRPSGAITPQTAAVMSVRTAVTRQLERVTGQTPKTEARLQVLFRTLFLNKNTSVLILLDIMEFRLFERPILPLRQDSRLSDKHPILATVKPAKRRLRARNGSRQSLGVDSKSGRIGTTIGIGAFGRSYCRLHVCGDAQDGR